MAPTGQIVPPMGGIARKPAGPVPPTGGIAPPTGKAEEWPGVHCAIQGADLMAPLEQAGISRWPR